MSVIGKVLGAVLAVLIFAILMSAGLVLLIVGVSIAIVAAPVLLVADYLSNRRGWR